MDKYYEWVMIKYLIFFIKCNYFLKYWLCEVETTFEFLYNIYIYTHYVNL